MTRSCPHRLANAELILNGFQRVQLAGTDNKGVEHIVIDLRCNKETDDNGRSDAHPPRRAIVTAGPMGLQDPEGVDDGCQNDHHVADETAFF